MSSRVCVKSLPKHCDAKRLRELFADVGEVTDCKIVATKDGRSRQFGFVGFRTAEQAYTAIKRYDKAFLDTARLKVEFAREVGSESLERPWSKYSQGSSRHTQLHGKQQPDQRRVTDADGSQPRGNRKRQKVVQEEADDPKLAEFLSVMQARSKKALWANDDATALPVKVQTPAVPSVETAMEIDTDGDDEDVFDATNLDAPAANTASGGAPSAEEEGGRSQPTPEELQSDEAYLRSKRKAVLLDEDDDWEAHEQQGQQQQQRMAVESNGVQQATSCGDTCVGDGEPNALRRQDAESALTDIEADEQLATDSAQPSTENATLTPSGKASGQVSAAKLDCGAAVEVATDGQPDISDTGRLFVRNLAYSVTEDELRATFEQFGELQELHLVLDKLSGKSKGIALVQYAMPADAVKAATQLDGTIFMGRLLHVLPAKAAPKAVQTDVAKDGKRGSSFKVQREAERKADAGNRMAWNTLFMRQDTVAEAVAAHYGLTKAELLDREAADLPLRMALGETHVIAATKKDLDAAGVDVEKLEAAAAASGKASATASVARSSTTLLVKNLPYSATKEELEDLLGGPGGLIRLVLPSTKTLAIVEYLEPQHARRAFKTLAYRRYHHVPIYLEWAPKDIFLAPSPAPQPAASKAAALSKAPGTQGASAGAGSSVTIAGVVDVGLDDATQDSNAIYVKNLSWNTSDERLRAHFDAACKAAGGVLRSSKVSRKKGPKGDMLSMGFGFVECSSEAVARAVIAQLQGSKLDGHQLLLQLSKRSSRPSVQPAAPAKASPCSKLVVRNVAFEATRKDVFGLFSPFGHVKSCRLPKKFDGTPRGFAFVEMGSKQEAKGAMEGLLGTHLYGRRVVLEWAAEDDSLEGLRAKTAAKYHDDSMQAALARGHSQAVDRA